MSLTLCRQASTLIERRSAIGPSLAFSVEAPPRGTIRKARSMDQGSLDIPCTDLRIGCPDCADDRDRGSTLGFHTAPQHITDRDQITLESTSTVDEGLGPCRQHQVARHVAKYMIRNFSRGHSTFAQHVDGIDDLRI